MVNSLVNRNAENMVLSTVIPQSSSFSPQVHHVHHIHHHHHHRRRHSSSNLEGTSIRQDASTSSLRTYSSIKLLSLNNLNAKQHFLIALCRDLSLLPPILSFFHSLKKAWDLSYKNNVLYSMENKSLTNAFKLFWQTYTTGTNSATNSDSYLLTALITARSSEYLLCSLWCLVSMYLSYSILDSLMVRWIVKYSTLAAILRMFSMSLIFITLELLLLSSLSPQGNYYLHTWIMISCILTGAYIWQSFLTSNLNYVQEKQERTTSDESSGDDLAAVRRGMSNTGIGEEDTQRKKRKKYSKNFKFTKNRQINLYNITVFCVVPVGIASFITMIGLLRNLVIQRLDVEQLERIFRDLHKEWRCEKKDKKTKRTTSPTFFLILIIIIIIIIITFFFQVNHHCYRFHIYQILLSRSFFFLKGLINYRTYSTAQEQYPYSFSILRHFQVRVR